MQKIFKIWIISIFVLTIIASIIVGIESALFGFVLMPLSIITGIIIILGFLQKR